MEYLFNLDKQVVIELAYLNELDGGENPNVKGQQLAIQLRAQVPVNWGTTWNATIFRFDAMYGLLEDDDDLSGIRFEIRQKF